MSRTDKTKPWWVRVAEHKPWADHDHKDGVCDLSASPYDNNPWSTGGVGERIYHCRWSDWNLAGYRNCCQGCSCRICSGYYWRKADRRRRRHQARNATRKAVNLQDWETDIHTPRTPW